jgi:ABC-type sugar transport system substrate-binding protein
MEAATKELSEQYGFEFVVADAESTAEKQMTQMQTFISDGVDGMFILVADVGTAPAMAQTAAEAGVPLIGDSLRLADDQGKLVAPAVELYSYECGHMAGEWIAQNYKSIGFDFGDYSEVAFCTIDNSTQPNAGQRCEGAEVAWTEGFPDFPQDKMMRADVAADSGQGADAAFNQISSMIAANPQVKTWVIVPAVEDYGVGAARALEAAGLDTSSIIVGIGGERAVEEWDGGLTKCWYASVYYEAKDCATLIIQGLLDVIQNGTDLKDLYPEFKEDGQDYAAAKFTGRMVTPDNYKEYVSK